MKSIDTEAVSFIIPVKGDRKVNVTVQSILSQMVPKCEILVVRNGKDSLVVESGYLPIGYTKGIKISQICREQAGKGRAINFGISFAKYDLIAVIDADCILDSDAFRIALKHFRDNKVCAVGGKLSVLTDKFSVLPEIQNIDYGKVFNLARRIFSFVGCNFIISGAFGIFRKDVLLSVGGYDITTVGEDFELVLRLRRLTDYRIVYEPDAVCFTGVPDSIITLFQQRDRWQRGFMEAIYLNRDLFFNRKYGFFGMFFMPFVFAFGMISPFLIVFGLFGVLNCFFPPWYIYFYVVFQVVLAGISELFEYNRQSFLSFIIKTPICMALDVGLQIILSVARIVGIFTVKKKHLKWNGKS